MRVVAQTWRFGIKKGQICKVHCNSADDQISFYMFIVLCFQCPIWQKTKQKNPPESEIENVRYMDMADYNLCKIIYIQKLPRVQNKCINFQYIILHDKEIRYF